MTESVEVTSLPPLVLQRQGWGWLSSPLMLPPPPLQM